MIRKRPAFTLIEILVILVTIAILVVILLPVLIRARERFRQNTCCDNQRQINWGLMMAMQDSAGTKDTFPGTQGVADGNLWLQSVSSHVQGGIWRCPSNTLGNSKLDYGVNYYLYGQPMGELREVSARVVVLADASNQSGLIRSAEDIAEGRHLGGYIVTFLDGHQEYLPKNGSQVIFADGGQGKYLCYGAKHWSITFTSDANATGQGGVLSEGDIVLLNNHTKISLTPRVAARGGVFSPAEGLVPGRSDVTIEPGQARAFSLHCRTGSFGEKVETVYTFGEAPNAVEVTVQEHAAPADAGAPPVTPAPLPATQP